MSVYDDLKRRISSAGKDVSALGRASLVPIQGIYNHVVRPVAVFGGAAVRSASPKVTFDQGLEKSRKSIPQATFGTKGIQDYINRTNLPRQYQVKGRTFDTASTFKNFGEAGGVLATGGLGAKSPVAFGRVAALDASLPATRLAGYSAIRAAQGAAAGIGTRAAQEGATSKDLFNPRNLALDAALGAGANALGSPRLLKAAGDQVVETRRIGEGANALVKKLDARIPSSRIVDNLPGNVPVRSGAFTQANDVTNQDVLDALVNKGKADGRGARYIKAPAGNSRVIEDTYGTGNLLHFSTDNPKFTKQLGRFKTLKAGALNPQDRPAVKGPVRSPFTPDARANAAAANIERAVANGAPVQGPLPILKEKSVPNVPVKYTETPEAVAQGIQSKLDNLEKSVYGSATSQFKPKGEKGAGVVGTNTRLLQEGASSLVAKGLASENPFARTIAKTVRGLFGQSGNSAAQTEALGSMRGGIDNAVQLSNDFYEYGTSLVNKDKGVLERLHAALDPDLAKGSVPTKFSPQEKEALNVLRQVSDIVNDSNYAQGRISKEVWEKSRGGKYIARAYEAYDLPPEVSKALSTGRGKQDLGQFKARTDVNEWKVDNAIRDPFYLMGKRLQQTFANDSVAQYGKFISRDPNMVSAIERPGFTKLADSPAWGDLSGKYVRQDVLEGIKGFYSDHKAVQGLYDALNAYDRFGPRQFLKKTKTVYNPATRLGNQVGNRTFALLNGVNPFSFEKNVQTYAKRALATNDPLVRTMRKQGLLGTDMSRKELVQKLADMGVEKSGLAKANDYITKSYGAADDHAKIAAYKYWIDKGKSAEEAATKVRMGFQDYNTVGLFYDLGAKTPIFGSAFVRFQGDLLRIIKNAALENPLGVAGVVGGIKLVGDFASKVSGENPEDRKTRESRLGSPTIPYTKIPLAIQTPWGEVNAARLFGIYAQTPAGGDSAVGSQVSRQLPFQVPTNKEDLLKGLGSDILAGPVISLATDTDFRGKSIADPDQNKYQPSTLTPGEKNLNRARFLERQYMPSLGNAIEDVGQAVAGKPDFYGKTRTPAQALGRLAGVKVEQFGPQQAQLERDKKSLYGDYALNSIRDQIKAVEKDAGTGKIDAATAAKRIKYLEGQLQEKQQTSGSSSPAGSTPEVSNGGYQAPQIKHSSADNKFYFYDDAGIRQSFDTKQKAELSYARSAVASGKQDRIEIGDKIIVADPENTNGYKEYSKKKISSDAVAQQLTNDLEAALRTKDYGAWKIAAEKQYKILEDQNKALDPILEAADILANQNKMRDLQLKYLTYKGYGGLTKSKKGRKLKSVSKVTLNRKPKLAKAPKTGSPVAKQKTLKSLSLKASNGTAGKKRIRKSVI